MRARTESAILLVALALSGAFIVSFVIGFFGESYTTDDPDPPVATADPPPPAASDSVAPVPAARVEVLNASGTAGLARRATDALRAAGFDVIFFGNAPAAASPDSTIVLDRTGNAERAHAVARALGRGRVETAIDSTLQLDVTVVLGRDWPAAGDSIR